MRTMNEVQHCGPHVSPLDHTITLCSPMELESQHQPAPADLACSRGLPMVRFSPSGQSIAVFIAPHPDGAQEGSSDEEERVDEDVVTVHWSSVFWNKCVRQLVDQSHTIFTQVQEADPSPDGVLPYSKLYRAALHECVLGLNTMLEDGRMLSSVAEEEQISDQSNLYSLLEVVWHLCEILFIEVLPAGCLIQQLLEWVRWHSGHNTDDMIQEILSSPRPSSCEHYWAAVYSTVLQGRPRECVELLSHHDYCRYHPQAHTSISELLCRMPMVGNVAGRSRAELRTSWAEWRSECLRRRQRGDYAGCSQLQTISELLCGEESCFKHQEVVDSCNQWYELMVGRLLYCSPLVTGTDYELHYIAQECMSLYHNGDQCGVFDQLLMTALQNNMIDTLKLSSSELSDWWFVAHLSNILHRCGALVVSQYEYGGRLTEFVLAEYANSLLTNISLWHIAMNYFSYCPEHGRGYMMACIERVPLSNEYKALKVLKTCNRYQLKEQGHMVCKVMAVRGYRSGRLGVAFTWCIRANDSAFAAFIAEKYFDNYHNLGQFRDLDLLDHLESAMLLSPRLAFLGKYRQFHLQYSNGEFKAAAQLLVALLSSGIVPQQYWSTILIDALPLLELKDQLLFSSDQTTSFMHYLAADHDDDDSDHDDDAMDDSQRGSHKHPLLLLALSRNIQRNGLQYTHS